MRKAGKSEAGMIIAGWRGFEIDSSEGYYVFDKEMEHVDDGSEFLSRLLSSPLVWKNVAFSFQPRRGRPGYVDGVLTDWRKKNLIRTEERDAFAGPTDVIAASDFLALFQEVRADLDIAWVYFAVVPPKLLDGPVSMKLRQWFFRQFDEEKTARMRWADYLRIKEEHIRLSGHTDMTDSWTDAMGLEATLEIRLKRPFEYKVFLPAGDPTMIVHLLWQIADRFHLDYEGDHGISINMTPDRLPFDKLMPEDSSE